MICDYQYQLPINIGDEMEFVSNCEKQLIGAKGLITRIDEYSLYWMPHDPKLRPYPNTPWNCEAVHLRRVLATEAVDPSRFPHSCPKCKAPAFVGFTSVDCSKGCK
jgi:hypothetical protein